MSTQNHIRLCQLIAVAVKLVKYLTISVNKLISQVNSIAQCISKFIKLLKFGKICEFLQILKW